MPWRDRCIAEAKQRRKDEVCSPISGAQFLITVNEFFSQCSQNDSDIVALDRNLGLFLKITGVECSSLCAGLGSQEFFYYPGVMKAMTVRRV